MSFITLITGPGTHAHLIIKKLIAEKYDFQYAQYWPEFKIFIYTKGSLIQEKRFIGYDLLNHLLWGLFHFLGISRGYKYHLDLLYPLYDFIISINLKDTSHLIAWPQVSLISIKKVKKSGGSVELEYPMIHVDEHINILKKEYKKWGIPLGKTDNLFSASMTQRIKNEIEKSDVINVLSTYAKMTFIKHGVPEEKLMISIPDLKLKNPILEQKRNNNKYIILYVGRIDIMKGIQYLLLAFDKLKIKNSELWLVGNRSVEIDPIISKYKSEKIKSLGYKKNNELLKIYNKASIFVLPSIQESFGMVLLEAQSLKIPIIASRNSGAPDLLEKGFNIKLYDPCDVKSLMDLLFEGNKKL